MEDLIRREDALKALAETEEIKGNAYIVMKQALEEIPKVKADKGVDKHGRKLDHH